MGALARSLSMGTTASLSNLTTSRRLRGRWRNSSTQDFANRWGVALKRSSKISAIQKQKLPAFRKQLRLQRPSRIFRYPRLPPNCTTNLGHAEKNNQELFDSD